MNFVLRRYILIIIMQKHANHTGPKHFLKRRRIVSTHQEHMPLLKAAVSLLRHLTCGELLSIHELKFRVDWFVLGFCFIGNIFDSY